VFEVTRQRLCGDQSLQAGFGEDLVALFDKK